VTLSWQGSLFDSEGGPALDFDRLVRHQLDERSWIDEVQGWAPDHAAVFDELLRVAPWQQRERWMYDRSVLEPRMVASWPSAALGDLPASVEAMRQAVSDRYRVEFDSVHVNLYRDGRDGVAWHGEEGVGRGVTDGRLAGELQTKLIHVEVYAPVEIQNPIAGVHVAHRSLLSVAQHFSLSAGQHFSTPPPCGGRRLVSKSAC